MLFYFFISIFISFLIANSPLNTISPQIIATSAILIIILSFLKKSISPLLISFVINLIVFSTGGLQSPLLFLNYFLLFSLSFQNNPRQIIIQSLIIIFFLSQTLNSLLSLTSLISFLFISPLAYLVTQFLEKNNHQQEEVLLWLTLELKQQLLTLIDNPHPNQQTIKKIIDQSNRLINELSQTHD